MKFLHQEYYNNDNINKPIEDIWKDIESYTNEIFTNDTKDKKVQYSNVDILLPILRLGDNFVKGLIVSRASDYICSVIPNLKNHFNIIGNSMWGSISKSENADAYFMCYENPKREAWLRANFPHLAQKQLIPLQDVDYTNENRFFPVDVEKDIDVLMVSRLHLCKNLDIFLKSLIYINKKYGKKLKAVLLTGQEKNDDETEKVYTNLIELAGSKEELESYIEIINDIPSSKMFMYYSRAKITALTSIFEGKNRSLAESMLCNTPVLCFSAFNKYIRLDSPIFPDGCGYCVDEFSSEAFGEKLYELIESGNIVYNTRKKALRYYNRVMAVDKIIKMIPYYNENIPRLNESNIVENDFVNKSLSLSQKAGSYEDFLLESNIKVPLHDNDNYQFLLKSNMI